MNLKAKILSDPNQSIEEFDFSSIDDSDTLKLTIKNIHFGFFSKKEMIHYAKKEKCCDGLYFYVNNIELYFSPEELLKLVSTL